MRPDSKPRPNDAGARWLGWAGTVMVLALLGQMLGCASLGRWEFPRRFVVVEPGHLYRSSQPTPAQLERILDEYGVRTFLVLRHPVYPEFPAEKQIAEERGVELVVLPITSVKPLEQGELQTLRDLYADPTRHPILAHCEHGVARTGVAVALWRIETEGWEGDRAVEEMIERGYPIREKNQAMRERLRRWQPPPRVGVETTHPLEAGGR